MNEIAWKVTIGGIPHWAYLARLLSVGLRCRIDGCGHCLGLLFGDDYSLWSQFLRAYYAQTAMLILHSHRLPHASNVARLPLSFCAKRSL